MSLLFVELKMRGEFPEHGRKVEILIEQAAEQAATARQERSKQVLKRGSFMPYFPLTPLTKKS